MTITRPAPTSATGAPTPPADPHQAQDAGRRRRPPARRKSWLLVVVAATAVAVAVLPSYLGLNPATSRVDVSNVAPWHYAALILHISGAVLALAAGPWQFSAAVHRRPRLHRTLGRIYLFAGVLPGSVGGITVAVLSTAGPTGWVGFGLLDVLWFTTALLGWRAARTHRYLDHGAWLTRNYALTFAGVTLRFWLGILTLALQPLRGSYFHGDGAALAAAAYLVTPWLSWVPNLIIGEALVARLRRPGRPPLGPTCRCGSRN